MYANKAAGRELFRVESEQFVMLRKGATNTEKS